MLFTGNFLPPLYFLPLCPKCEWANLKLAKFFFSIAFESKHNQCGQILEHEKWFPRCKRVKITQGENNLVYGRYTVKPLDSDICVICFPVLTNTNFYALSTIFLCVLH